MGWVGELFGVGQVGDLGYGGQAVLLECLELGEGVFIGLFHEGDAAVEAHEFGMGVVEGFAEGDAVETGGAGGVEFPEVGFGAEEATEHPLVADEGIDLEALFGGAGLEAGEIFDLEAVEIGALLAVAELGIGVEAGFESVLGRHSFALGGARTGGLLRVEAIGLDLTEGCHRGSLNGNGTGRVGVHPDFRVAGGIGGIRVGKAGSGLESMRNIFAEGVNDKGLYAKGERAG
jgi:hypothetical protein